MRHVPCINQPTLSLAVTNSTSISSSRFPDEPPSDGTNGFGGSLGGSANVVRVEDRVTDRTMLGLGLLGYGLGEYGLAVGVRLLLPKDSETAPVVVENGLCLIDESGLLVSSHCLQ